MTTLFSRTQHPRFFAIYEHGRLNRFVDTSFDYSLPVYPRKTTCRLFSLAAILAAILFLLCNLIFEFHFSIVGFWDGIKLQEWKEEAAAATNPVRESRILKNPHAFYFNFNYFNFTQTVENEHFFRCQETADPVSLLRSRYLGPRAMLLRAPGRSVAWEFIVTILFLA